MPSGFDDEVAALQARTRHRSATDRLVLFYGSSTFTLWSDIGAHFPGRNIVNHGFGGATLADCLKYFDRLVKPMRPCAVILYAGDNDLDQGTTPEAVRSMVGRFVERKRQSLGAIPLAYVSIKVSPARLHFMHRIGYTNLIVERALRGEPDIRFLDITRRMVGRGLMAWQGYYDSDPLHMNGAGYRLWGQSLREWLGEMIGAEAGPREGAGAGIPGLRSPNVA